MILHCVFCNFRTNVTADQQQDAMRALADFSMTLDGVLDFEFGPNRDFELKSQAFDQGFVIRFADADALHVYAEHPTHRKLGGQLASLCNGGGDGIIVFDLDV